MYTRLGVRPPRWMEFEFSSPDQAIEFALEYPHPKVELEWGHLPDWVVRAPEPSGAVR
jgi:hypothetical protein